MKFTAPSRLKRSLGFALKSVISLLLLVASSFWPPRAWASSLDSIDSEPPFALPTSANEALKTDLDLPTSLLPPQAPWGMYVDGGLAFHTAPAVYPNYPLLAGTWSGGVGA
jgi:hypothetical protein